MSTYFCIYSVYRAFRASLSGLHYGGDECTAVLSINCLGIVCVCVCVLYSQSRSVVVICVAMVRCLWPGLLFRVTSLVCLAVCVSDSLSDTQSSSNPPSAAHRLAVCLRAVCVWLYKQCSFSLAG